MKNLILLAAAVLIFTAACDVREEKPALPGVIGAMEEEIKGEISVSYYDRTSYGSYLEEAAKAFEEKYPVKVNLTPFSVMPDVNSTASETGSITALDIDSTVVNDYISRISTELMSGNGADIMAMDVLPHYKFAESGMLEDLSLWMDADGSFYENDYYYNIIQAMRYKGGQYIFPLDFSFEYISVMKDMFDESSLRQLDGEGRLGYDGLIQIGNGAFELANAKSGAPVRMFDWYKAHKAKDIFIELFNLNYDRFVDLENKRAYFTGGEFAELLEAVKDYVDNGYFIPKAAVFDESEPCLYRIKNIFVLYSDDKDKELPILIENKAGEIIFDCGQGYALNSNSQNKKCAWEFIKFLASEEMQQRSIYSFSRPININANKEKARVEVTAESINFNESGMEVIFLEDKEAIEKYESYLSALNTYTSMLDAYIIKDSIIGQMVSKEADRYFEGAKTSTEAAENLQNGVELYLNE